MRPGSDLGEVWEFALDAYDASDTVEEKCCLGLVVATSAKPGFHIHHAGCRVPHSLLGFQIGEPSGMSNLYCGCVMRCV